MILALASVLALACAARAQTASTSPPSSSYDLGHAQRRAGRSAEAKETFLRLLQDDPSSGGALEGLTLSCLSRHEYDEALGYARRWDQKKPDSAYVLGLEERALRGLRREEEALDIGRRIVTLDPCDARLQRRVDDGMRERRAGVFSSFRLYKSAGPEGLETSNPQRIVYEGRSGSVRARQALRPNLDLVGGIEASQEAQRNDTGGFAYYDIFEETTWGGLEGRPNGELSWGAEYGQSLMHDIRGAGVGRATFSRAKLKAAWRGDRFEARVRAERAPSYLRGAGASRFFVLLRESSMRADVEGSALGLDWLGRAGASSFSEGTTLKTWGLSATKEYASELAAAAYSHGQTEFFGAAPDGRLRYVMTDRLGARWRRLVEDSYRLSASYGYSWHRDGNRLHEFSAEAAAWLPWLKDGCGLRPLKVAYRRDSMDYAVSAEGYRSTDNEADTLGGYWRQGWRHGLWTTLGYEYAFNRDNSRGHYESRAWLGEIEAYRSGALSLSAEGRVGASTVRDESYSAGGRARWSF